MTPDKIASELHRILTSIAAANSADIEITEQQLQPERPKNRAHGDWASNAAMQFGKRIGMNPRALAEQIAAELKLVDGIAAVEIAGPGFINITLDVAAAGQIAQDIVLAGAAYGRNSLLSGQSINLEFVSANPTGPVHLGHTRWAALGDSLARVLKAAGADIVSEYYINDAGAQMQKFGRSVLAAALNQPAPEDGYPGKYIQVLGEKVLKERPDLVELSPAEQLDVTTEIAYRLQLGEIKSSLANFNVNFDVWFSERTLHEQTDGGKSKIEIALDRLREAGHVYEEGGATWVRTSTFGDDKDRVFTRGNGIYTYFAADAAYLLSKSSRGSYEKIYLLGADHHGYVGRLKALSAVAGEDPERQMTVLIGQLVMLNGARLSKRAGNIVELDDLLEWVGSDALRFWLSRYPADSPLSLEGEKLRSRTNDNPVFYVQYAHARTCAVDRNAAAVGLQRDVFQPELLTHTSETELLGKLQQYPGIVAGAAQLREPHRITRYLEELAGSYHRWYDQCRVLPQGDEAIQPLHQTRLWLNDAAQQVLANGLDLIGVSAPERL
ncbi:arginine--tRNA ligase [Canibacter zhoujuaniae]|uniref:arginine--tRNA ligase n=1 Tax=Canibacter zhoujuaniae TaxID=2708343 RepID=UPI00141DD352|nr:arginine--tRNA ligase [Canibacter zhoujuaniae]